jgi:calpain-7
MTSISFQAVEQKARNAEEKACIARSRHDALEATITAVEQYLQALRLAPSSLDKARIDSKCKELLSRAETLKEQSIGVEAAGQAPRSSTPSQSALRQPTSKRNLTTREEIIVLEGSKLNGFIFPPWKEDPKPEEFVLKEGQEPFVDSPKLQLSPLQLKSFAGWKRPWEAFSGIEIVQDGARLPTQPTMKRSEKIDLVQDMTSDCSVVASLCAGSARGEKGHPRVSGCSRGIEFANKT